MHYLRSASPFAISSVLRTSQLVVDEAVVHSAVR
jgi:hypothetical protein